MYKKDAPDTLVWEDIYQVKYIKIDLARKYRPGDKGGLFVFVSEDIYNAGQYTSDCIYDIMCKLVNNYKVIK